MQPVGFDPGINGFVKAHRHPCGSALVMTKSEDGEHIDVFWVKRLAHNAEHIDGDCFRVVNKNTIITAERYYDFHLSHGPPVAATADFQRKRVYDWEDNEFICHYKSPMTWAGCERFLDYVWTRVGNGPPPKLTNQRRYRTAISLTGSIHLPKNDSRYRIQPVILHELTHELLLRDHGHDAVFVSVYMDLVERFLGYDRCRLEETADQYRVVYNPSQVVTH